jgi:hypothetical protein
MLEDLPRRLETLFSTRVATMNRYLKIACVTISCAPLCGVAQAGSAPAPQAVIYKHVDENGRVTYANSPIKGGVRVELEPLTVIPSTPGGSLSQASARAPYTMPVPVAVVAPIPRAAHVSVASITSAPSPVAATVSAAVSAPVGSAPIAAPAAIMAMTVMPELAPGQLDNKVASLEPADLLRQRLAEIRKRNLEDQLRAEEQSLVAASAALSDEQRRSGTVRAMRASFSTTEAAVTPQKPLLAPELRAEIERHFERVRNLQDQVAMHENNLQGFREQLNTLK